MTFKEYVIQLNNLQAGPSDCTLPFVDIKTQVQPDGPPCTSLSGHLSVKLVGLAFTGHATNLGVVLDSLGCTVAPRRRR